MLIEIEITEQNVRDHLLKDINTVVKRAVYSVLYDYRDRPEFVTEVMDLVRPFVEPLIKSEIEKRLKKTNINKHIAQHTDVILDEFVEKIAKQNLANMYQAIKDM